MFTLREVGMKGGSCGEVSPVLSPPSPSLTPFSPLPALPAALRPAAQTKPRLFAPSLSLSSLSSDSCHLLTSSTWRQWREGGTGADWCLPVCQWRFLPLRPLPFSFSPSPQTKLGIQSAAAHSSFFSSSRDSESVGTDLLYIDGLI